MIVTAGVVAANIGGVTDPSSVPTANAASVLLNDAAQLQLTTSDPQVGPEQYLRTTIAMSNISKVHEGWENSSDPFNEHDGQILAAVRTESVSTQYEREGAPLITEELYFHGVEVLGDAATAQAAWDGYYGDTNVPPIGTAPEPIVWEVPSSPYLLGTYPTNPQQYLDEHLAAAKEMEEVLPEELRQPPERSMWVAMGDESFHSAPAAYRATHLKALALLPGITITHEDDARAVLECATSRGDLYRVTLDTHSGRVLKVEERFSERANPDGSTPPFLEGKFDISHTITQDVVDAAPQVTEPEG
ncbi:hypothetical protein [Microbacterium sp. Leaf320]|uniref:hypothetical protein n=1 Tax=Microbacterium sp. Leaf320 TaxID=1736334 RepID=UPI0006FD681C|nr:hypothetical protein [Microbacterium sp. Leaf320]KQQ65361.1 hypothetical protein ASF63_15605 [Microbacterium sp. Leaf320]